MKRFWLCICFLFLFASMTAVLITCGDDDDDDDNDSDDDDSGEPSMDCDDFCNNEDYVQIAMDCGLLNATDIEDGILECLTLCEGQGVTAEAVDCFTAFTDCETLLKCLPGEQ